MGDSQLINPVSEESMMKYIIWDALSRTDRFSVIIYPRADHAIQSTKKLVSILGDIEVQRITRDSVDFMNGNRVWLKTFSIYALKGLKLTTIAYSSWINQNDRMLINFEAPVLLREVHSKLIAFDE